MHVSTLLLGLVGAFMALTVHELGHLVAGLAVGFRFSLFATGPILVERTPSGQIRATLNRTLAFVGGVAATVPVGTGGLKNRFAVVVAGGPVTSALLGLVAAASIPLVSSSHPFVRTELSWLRLLSSLLFLGTAVPVRNGPFVTDGLRFLRLVRRGAHSDRELALITHAALQRGGVRPRDWNQALLLRAVEIHDSSMFECQVLLYSYMHHLDRQAVSEAAASLRMALALAASLPDSLKADCLLEAAYFAATYEKQPAAAREFLARVPPRAFGVLQSDRLRAEAAIAIAEGHSDAANDFISRAISCSPAWATGPRAWLDTLEAATSPEA
jgi:hypothetical protein